jgi:hypothetical protein
MGRQYLKVHRLDGFSILILLPSSRRRLPRKGSLIQKMLSDEELLIVLRRQINFDREQKPVAIDL